MTEFLLQYLWNYKLFNTASFKDLDGKSIEILDFGIWKFGKDEDGYDYELEHFKADGDIDLGGENIIKELAYKVFTENSDTLLKKRIQYVRPENYDGILDAETWSILQALAQKYK